MQSVLPLEAVKCILVEFFLTNPYFIQERYITTNYFRVGGWGGGGVGWGCALTFLLQTYQTLEKISFCYGCYGVLYQYDLTLVLPPTIYCLSDHDNNLGED